MNMGKLQEEKERGRRRSQWRNYSRRK